MRAAVVERVRAPGGGPGRRRPTPPSPVRRTCSCGSTPPRSPRPTPASGAPGSPAGSRPSPGWRSASAGRGAGAGQRLLRRGRGRRGQVDRRRRRRRGVRHGRAADGHARRARRRCGREGRPEARRRQPRRRGRGALRRHDRPALPPRQGDRPARAPRSWSSARRGPIGTNAVQLARHFGGASPACSGANAELVRSLGADHGSSTTRPPTRVAPRAVRRRARHRRHPLAPSGRRLLADGGVLLLVVADLADTLRARGDVRAGPRPSGSRTSRELLDLVAVGALRVVLDEVVPLDDVVAAHERVDSGRKVGNLVLHP